MNAANVLLSGGEAVRFLTSEGQGGTVLFFHGNSGSADLFAPILASPLGKRYRFIALDFPGHGSSARRQADHYAVPSLADVIAKFVKATSRGPYVVVGHSLGGHAAATALPQLSGLAGLMLVSAPPIDLPHLPTTFLPDPSGGAMFSGDLTAEQVAAFANALLGPGAVSSETRERVTLAIRQADPAFRPALLASILAGQIADERGNVASLPVPSCLVYGMKDRFLRLEAFRETTLQRPFGEGYYGFKESGHCPHLDNTEGFLKLLGEFLDSAVSWTQ